MTITLKSLSSLTSYSRRCILRHQPHRPRRLGFLFHLAAFPRAEVSEVGGTGAIEPRLMLRSHQARRRRIRSFVVLVAPATVSVAYP